jgi:hypothetical protein
MALPTHQQQLLWPSRLVLLYQPSRKNLAPPHE